MNSKSEDTSSRLKEYMQITGLRQTDILEKCKPYCEKYNMRLSKSLLSQYVSGAFSPKQKMLTVIAHALNVSEVWLMGYDVPMSRSESSSPTLSESEQFVVDAMRGFNAEGQQKVVDYVTDLSESGRYKKFSSSEIA